MDLSSFSVAELVGMYSQTIKELKNRGVLRTKNVVGELGEYLVLEYYDRDPQLPTLSVVPVGTKNINAISQNGERYSIKSTTGNVTGVIYGLEPQGSSKPDPHLFEYLVICKLDDDCELEGIYQLSWESFQKHKKWHSRMNAWNVAVTRAMREDSVVIYEKTANSEPKIDEKKDTEKAISELKQEESVGDIADVITTEAIVWNKTSKVNHAVVRGKVAKRLQIQLKRSFEKMSQSRYVSIDKETALFILSASYSQKNGEYWYSINDENIPWMDIFPECYVAFALGSVEQVLLFPYDRFKKMLEGCLKTKEEPDKKKKAHFHFSFAVEGSIVYFKKKVPEREFVNVSEYLV